MWFAGVHSDIGGGYPEKQSGLSKYPLLWMIDEAEKCGLQFNHAQCQPARLGHSAQEQPVLLRRADRRGAAAQFADGAWWLLEFLPKSAKYREWPERQVFFGFYIPDAEPRPIPEGAVIHESVVKRMEKVSDYRPVNLPDEV